MGLRSLLPRRRNRALSGVPGPPGRDRARRLRSLVLESLEDRQLLSTTIPLNPGTWTPIGPAPITGGQTPGANAVSGRITGVAADPSNPSLIYVATGGGGIWRTF